MADWTNESKDRIQSPRSLLVVSGIGAAMLIASPAAAQAGFCSDPDLALPAKQPSLAADDLVGTFRCADEGMTITLRLDADGRFEQRLEGLRRSLDPELQGDFDETKRVGRWRIEGNTLRMFERRTLAPDVKLVESRRDTSMRLRVEVREPGGRGARGISVSAGPAANPQPELSDGVLEIPLSHSLEPGTRQIVRQADGLRLTSFKVTRDGPNVFRFVYRPSQVEAFETLAYVIDAQGKVIGIPMGMSGAVLRRVSPPK